jgi:hypothetical protein
MTPQEVLTEAATLHGEDIPSDIPSLWKLLWRTEHARFRIGMAIAQAQQALAARRLQVLLPKDKDVTELDRTTTMEAGSAEHAASVKQLELAYELLNSRVMLLDSYIVFLDSPRHTEAQEES